ncbi:MAG: 3'-5' exoribonuclease [Gallionella sp.]|nr:3'-5' exoribonuclease [Gallionella sp.]
MQIFFDTEFTTIDKKVGSHELISIGCVSEDGREFYSELTDTWHPLNCSEFVVSNVLPLLEGGGYRMTEAELAVNLKVWIESLSDTEIIMRSDAPLFDWPWIEGLFQFHGCWPVNLRKTCGTIYCNHDSQIRRYQDAMGKYWKEHAARQHHALVDAKSLQVAWKFAMKKGI